MKKIFSLAVFLFAFLFICQLPAQAGRPILKTFEGFISEIEKVSDYRPSVTVKAGGAPIKVEVNNTTTLKKAGKSVEMDDLKVGDRVQFNQMKQDGKVVYTTIDVL